MKFLNKTIYTTNFSKFYTTFPKVKGVDKLVAEGKLPPRLLVKDYTINGDNVFHNCKEIGGVTIYNGIGKGSDVFLFKYAFQSKFHLFMVMGHELLHANYNMYKSIFDEGIQHKYIDIFEKDLFSKFKIEINNLDLILKSINVDFFKYSIKFNPKFHYSNFNLVIPNSF